VTDFGLAKSLGGDVAASGGVLTGTPTFASPECAADVRRRWTGVYALNLVAWFLPRQAAVRGQSIGQMISTS
jgi:hypothetical protein